jgi:hypothetical protein
MENKSIFHFILFGLQGGFLRALGGSANWELPCEFKVKV